MNGEGAASMFYVVVIFIAVYFIGTLVYIAFKKIGKARRKNANG